MNMKNLYDQVIAELDAGNFTRLEQLLSDNNASLVDLLVDAGKPKEHLDEAFSWACMLGRAGDAERLLDLGADPLAGIKTGLNGFHYAASGGRLEIVKLLIERKVPMEVKNIYGGTVLDQAIWSAANEHTANHSAIVESLIQAGAVVEQGYSEWWEKQTVPTTETRERIAAALKHAEAS